MIADCIQPKLKSHAFQGLEQNQKLMEQALDEINHLMVTLLAKEFSSLHACQ